MSREKKNKPRRTRITTEPPENISLVAANYTCGHCDSNPAKLRRTPDGIWHLDVEHDDTCLVYFGQIPDDMDLLRATGNQRILRIRMQGDDRAP